MNAPSHRISFNEDLDMEARVFSSCFIKTLDKQGTKVFSSR